MFSNPIKNVEQFGLMPGMHVADLGAGVGYYAIPAAKAVGDKGRVFAVEVQKDLLGKIKRAAEAEHVHNIEFLWGDIEKHGGTHLADGSVDFVILANILFQVSDKAGLVREAHRILRKSGKLCLIDWKESYGGIGPASRDVITEAQGRELLGQHGFTFTRTIGGGDHHYGLVYVKS